MGGRSATQSFARLFMLPITSHCGGGYGPNETDLVNPVVDWVERDAAPARLTTAQRTDAGDVVRTRPVFPYPQRAHYKGTGSVDEAANFTAVTPTREAPVKWVGEDLFRRGD